jgi:hypothetical protein
VARSLIRGRDEKDEIEMKATEADRDAGIEKISDI